ncbi:hypothetical protein BJX66DRAFT_337105 [Aspergillus keveii]|uniref:BTB domain-containing protein n=1 Tax=Aspergillus keveii TaxID=714993 RepID=A0ABR4G8G5_9EURO
MSSPDIQVEILTPPGSQTSSPTARTTREVIDEDGDMIITISQSSYLVSSKAISLASPVFRAKFKKHNQQESASNCFQNKVNNKCRAKDKLLGAYFQGLYSVGLLPGFSQWAHKNCTQIRESVERFPDYDYECEQGTHCGCLFFEGMDQKDRLLEKLGKCWDPTVTGLCLFCLKNEQCSEHSNEG